MRKRVEEKERPAEDDFDQDEADPGIKVKVTIHGKFVEVDVKSGSTLADLIEELKRLGLIRDEHEFMVMLDGRVIRFDVDGHLTENPVLDRNSTLSLLRQIKGGKYR